MKAKTLLFLVFALFLSLAVIMGCGKSKDDSSKKKSDDTEETSEKKRDRSDDRESSREMSSDDEDLLYFCEDYVNGKEIGKSEVFTPGWLTVMVNLRPVKKNLGTGKVDLRLTKIKDEDGKNISDEIIETIPFNVEPDWDYTYFQDKKKLSFREPGTYRATLMKTDGTPICSGQVKVISK
ncbi:MAG: hypothetical protein JW917_06360 [Ignavibacteria bacterium]|nr:hypothetical protein [Ignavibacteria bacterium]